MIFRLHTFGSVFLTRDGELLSGPAGQRRLLAILAVLANVGERGISRDKLLALLWSDGEPDRTRHALTQSLYHIRKALGSERIFLNGSDLRLNPEVMSADVGQFRRAFDEGRLEAAVEAYTGAFLDGFYLNGEPEFDFWVTAQRDRLARQYADALSALARAAAERSDCAAELYWRTRVADHDPLSGQAVAALMRCLIAAGDPGTALIRARAYESRLWAELELPPDKAVADIVSAVRCDAPRIEPAGDAGTDGADAPAYAPVDAPVDAPAYAHADAPVDAPAARPAESVVTAIATEDPADPPNSAATRVFSADSSTGRRGRRRASRWPIGVAAVVMVLGVGARAAASRIADAREALRRETIAVSPFRLASSSASAAYLRDALLELLPARIGEADRKRTADPTHVLDVWRRVAPAAESLSSVSAAARVGRRLDAGEILIGSIDEDARGVVVHASVIDAATSRVKASASVVGGTDSLGALTDRLITALVLPEAGERTVPASSMRATSPRALRAYLTGRAASRRGDYDGALTAFSSALNEDPDFALAALGLAVTADRANAAEQHDRGVAIAWKKQQDLPPSDRAFLRAFAGPRYPEPSSAAEVLKAWEDAVRAAPDHAEGWFQLGESFYYDGDLLAMRDALGRAEDAFRQALAFDPSFSPARRMLALLLARRADTSALRALVTRNAFVDTTDALAVFVRWRVAQALDDGRELARVRRSFDGAPSAALRAIAMTGQFDGVSTRDGDRAIAILRMRPLSEAEQVDLVLARHSRALNSNDLAGALTIGGELGAIQPALHPQLRLRVLDALYSRGDRDAARGAADALERSTRTADSRLPGSAPDSAVRMADLCVLAQWKLAQHDTAEVRSLIGALHAGAEARFPVPVGANPILCAELMETSLALASRGRAAADRLAHMDSLMLSGPAVGDAMRYANLVVAREYQRLGEPRRGLAALQRRSFMRGWPRYRATGLQLQIDLALAAGDTTAARSARQRLQAAR
ncbi:MAG TPA: BTAD domain-containing putative transcriptional regulator [Gemmatimonadaceae bacterium]|jgi:DNA-binding SARP family transcriptional activator/Tfp pilus assembly protein PilF/TolB-like protein|nr:BTAD domain-containing putative transcriptional regulator [Gemmatimonadaceae bacterium]